jgi:hypothetical protein
MVQERRGGSMESFMKWRWALLGLSVLLAVVLIANGNVLIGGLIGVMAVVRITMFSKMSRRRAELRAQYPGRFGQGGFGRGGYGPGRPQG